MNGMDHKKPSANPNPPRKGKGAGGGQYTSYKNTKHEAALASARNLLEERRRQLSQMGWLPAIPQAQTADTESAAVWWARTESIAELGRYEAMPRFDADGREARLRSYEGQETKVKMPSVNAVRRYAQSNAGTFDMPVEAHTPHGPITGHVRVTYNGNGRYSVSGVRMPAEHAEYVAETVLATLEARRPTRALAEVRDILARRRERLASQGASLREVDSSWIRGVGYNKYDHQLVMNLGGRVYGYHVDEQTYDDLMNSRSIGEAYNYLVKRVAPRFEVEQHEECGNYFYAGKPHRCPSVHYDPPTAPQFA